MVARTSSAVTAAPVGRGRSRRRVSTWPRFSHGAAPAAPCPCPRRDPNGFWKHARLAGEGLTSRLTLWTYADPRTWLRRGGACYRARAMNLVVLSRGPGLYSTKRIVSVARRRGHRVTIL